MKLGNLFAGIGGFDLAARWMGWETAWYAEIDPYCCAVMAKHFPEAKSLGDIRHVDWSTVERPDILCGGFPCQDVSTAGRRAGIDGARSGLWREFARAIRDLRPRYVVVENVPGLLAGGMGRVLGDLASLGFDAEWTVLSASAVGAPHLRERIWIVAYPQRVRELQSQGGECHERRWAGDCGTLLVKSNGSRRPHAQEGDAGGGFAGGGSAEGGAASGAGWWDVEPDVGRVAHGVPSRVDRLRALGNAIVPQCALEIFRQIAEWERVRP